jgi:RNA polymerase sigma-70 factor, ECF subfamily
LIDRQIIENCRKGSLDDFRKLVIAASPFAFSVAFRMLGDEALAEDIVQETMISVWKSISRIKSAESFNTWIYRIIYNKCCDELRKRKRKPEIITDEQTWNRLSDITPEIQGNELENREISAMINSLTAKLSPKQKAVFILADIEDRSNEEISEITGMSRFNVKANLHLARKKIAELIEKHL